MDEINLQSGSPSEKNTQPGAPQADTPQASTSIFNGNKGLIVAIILGLITVIVGVSALLGSTSGSKFAGLIKKVETETRQLGK